MKLTDWMEEKGLCVGVTLKDKDGVIDILTALQQKCGNTSAAKQLKREIYYREEESPCAVGAGVAICRVRTDAVQRPLITAVTAPAGADLDAPDGEKSKLIFLIAVPLAEGEEPASRLRVLLMNENLREQLIHAADEQTFLQLLQLAENGEYAAEPREEPALILTVFEAENEESAKAAAQLQLAAGRMGRLLKTELQGNRFTEEELREARGVLLIGSGLDRDRFSGKPILQAELSECLHRPEHLLHEAEQAAVYHKPNLARVAKKQFKDWYYRSRVPLLPMVLLSGGLLLLLGRVCAYWHSTVAEILRTMGEGTLSLVLPLISGMIAFRHARWPGLAVGLAGGLLLAHWYGGAWVTLLGGIAAGFLMQFAAKLPGRIAYWSAPFFGIAALGGAARLLHWLADLLIPLLQDFLLALPLQLRGALGGLLCALDPGGPLQNAVPEAMAAAAGLSLALGLTAFALLHRNIHSSNGWAALPAALGGNPGGYAAYFVGDPLRLCLPVALGGGLAGFLAACFAENVNAYAVWGISGAAGGVFTCLLLLCARKFCAHEVKR